MKTLQLIFGDATLLQWIFALALAMLGFIAFKLFTYTTRTKRTDFNPYYWWKDNRAEFYLGMIFFYILMRFHKDIASLMSEYFNFPLITNRYFLVFTIGLLFSVILKRGRRFFRLRQGEYPNGEQRIETVNRSAHVGNRPDDR